MSGNFPGFPLVTNKTNATLSEDDHPPAHNDLATAVNDLQGQVNSVVRSPLQYGFSTTITDSDPGNGRARFNNAVSTATTALYVDTLNVEGTTVSALLAQIDDSSSAIRGTLEVSNDDGSHLAVFNVTGNVIIASGYYKIPVAYVVGAGTFVDAEMIFMRFSRSGDRGASGSGNGASGGGNTQPYIFNTATADADPTTNKLCLNNATPSSATAMYVNIFSNAAVDLTAWLNTFDDGNSAPRGFLDLINEDGSHLAVYGISGASTSATGYIKLAITFVAGAGTFGPNEQVFLRFVANGNHGIDGTNGTNGSNGSNGTNGSNGASGAGSYPLNFDTATADADPGAGVMRMNNAAPASATILYVDDLTSAATDLSAFLATIDDGTSTLKGYVEISNLAQTKSQIYGLVAGVTHVTSYTKIPVVYIGGTGTFTNGEAVLFKFNRVGDVGVAGPAGAAVLPYLFDTSTTNSDPGSGKIRANNATLASVTAFYADDVDSPGVDIHAFLVSLGSSTAAMKGYVTIQNSDKTKLHVFTLTAAIVHVTAGGATYCTLTVSYMTGSGTFSAGEQVFLCIDKSGDTAVEITEADYSALSPPNPAVWYVIID